jgi:hypothetical protein
MVSEFDFNGDGFLTSQTIGGATTTFEPSAKGNRASSTDANGHKTDLGYAWGVVSTIGTPEYGIARTVRLDGAVTSETRNGVETA